MIGRAAASTWQSAAEMWLVSIGSFQGPLPDTEGIDGGAAARRHAADSAVRQSILPCTPVYCVVCGGPVIREEEGEEWCLVKCYL